MFKPDSKGHLRDDWYLSLSASSNELSEFNNMVNTIKVILKWTANVLSHSFNKNFYNSTEVSSNPTLMSFLIISVCL